MPIELALGHDPPELAKCVSLQRCVVLLNEVASSPDLSKAFKTAEQIGVQINRVEGDDSMIAITTARNAPCFLSIMQKIHDLIPNTHGSALKFDFATCPKVPLDRVIMKCNAEIREKQAAPRRCKADITVSNVLHSFATRKHNAQKLKPICSECISRQREEEKELQNKRRDDALDWSNKR